MIVGTERFCDSCNLKIAPAERDRVEFLGQDYHNSCYRKRLSHLFAMKKVLARSNAYEERR